MGYKNLRECVNDLEKVGQLVRIAEEVDPHLEMAEIQRRVFRAKGPAVFYEKVKGSPFPAVSNLFGTKERTDYIFRKTLKSVKKMVQLKANPAGFFKTPQDFLSVPFAALKALPMKVGRGPVFEHKTSIDQLPQIKSWSDDGGSFILLPQVYTENQEKPHVLSSNLGMYRIQLSGNDYEPNKEIGLHYQIRRDIGIHHHVALRRNEPLRVSIFIGGPPAHTFAAVMYLPEGLSEVALAGALAGRRFRYMRRDGFVLSAEADFCITGLVHPGKTKPEGPFGDHLGYYSLKHDFPYMQVENVYHRKDAIWPFTAVGRPPQEDSFFGALVQEIAGPILPKEIPGVKAVHAVDASGVHPLLLAIAEERYVPYGERKPQELLAHANAILGYGPCSLAKYLIIVAAEDDPELDVHKIDDFLKHFLERVDWQKDLHFQTKTTIDTLDYSGTGLNQGSKVIMAAAGQKKRELAHSLPKGFSFVEGFETPRFVMPGVLAIQSPAFLDQASSSKQIELFAKHVAANDGLDEIPLMVLVDDSDFASQSMNEFLWVVFTRSNPSHDIYGTNSFYEFKHWGCVESLIIDARIKPHHAPPLIEDPHVVEKVDRLALEGAALHGII